MATILESALARICGAELVAGVDLVERLAAAKAGDLHTLLMEVMRLRALRQRPRDVLEAHGRRFCAVSDVDARAQHRVDGAFFAALPPSFQLLELGPLAPLGCCTAVAPCDPRKIVTTVKSLEVVSDPSNVLALEAALRRNAQSEAARVDYAASHRAVRAQAFDNPDFRAHFRLFVLLSMFPARGSGREEARALADHLDFYRRALAALEVPALQGPALVRVSFSRAGQPWSAVRDAVAAELTRAGVACDDGDERIGQNAYYQGLSFKGWVRLSDARELPLIDGGFTDWGARLTSRAKERTLVSAIGSELLARAG